MAVNIAGHEAHGDARNWGLQRHACGEQRQCGRAHGDWASNAAMQLAKKAGMKPHDFAELFAADKIAKKLK